MLAQIGQLLIDTVAGLLVLLLLARFHFQWLRVPFRNPVGALVIALTNWIVMPARRILPALAGLDTASLVAAWVLQLAALWLGLALLGRSPAGADGFGVLAGLAAIDLLRYSLYFLIFSLIVQAVLSWASPYSPVRPVFDTLTRPFLRPLRRFVPPVANVDLSPLVLIVLLQIALIVVAYARQALSLAA